MKEKKLYYFIIHSLYIISIFYAFWHFINTPRSDILPRRLWAYENWIIISFYLLFVYLVLTEKDKRFKKAKNRLKEFRRILSINLILLIFPWGIFILLAPKDMLTILGLGSKYWKILATGSLIGALIYYFPYKYHKNKFTKYIFLFGIVDNLLAGAIVTYLFFLRRVPLIAFSSTPLLFYFSYFFKEQLKKVKKK